MARSRARSRYRSAAYDLAAAIEVARVAAEAGGSVSTDILAPVLGYRGTNNGAFLARMASARLFGLVRGPGNRVEVTERGRQVLAGREPAASLAKREAFLSVPLFRAATELLERSGRSLPEDVAGWLVGELGEIGSKAPSVSNRLVDSAGQAGLLHRLPSGELQLSTVIADVTAVDNNFGTASSTAVRWPRPVEPTLSADRAPLEDGMMASGRGDRHRSDSVEGDDETVDGSSTRERGSAVAEDLWLDEDEEVGAGGDRSSRSGRPRLSRRAGVVAAAAACLLVVAVPVGLVLAGSTSSPSAKSSTGKPGPNATLAKGVAGHQVLSALNATTASGNFDLTYTFGAPVGTGADAPQATSTTSTTTVPAHSPCIAVKSTGVLPSTPRAPSATSQPTTSPDSPPNTELGGSTGPTDLTVCPNEPADPARQATLSGHGTIDVSPFALVATTDVSTFGQVTVRSNGTDVWEEGGADYGLAPDSSDNGDGGGSISGFADVVDSTLGDRQGPLAMIALASPTGYFDLTDSATDGAQQSGTGTVDGVPVTTYQVQIAPGDQANAPDLTPDELTTINQALGQLQQQGYTGTTVYVSIDAAGYIRQTRSVAAFSDGTTMTSEATFSNFGCAGTVLMPGQTGATAPPAGCVSPDNPNSTTSTTTTTTGAGSRTTTPSTPSTTVPPSTTTTTTTGASPPSNSGSGTTSTTGAGSGGTPPSTTSTLAPSGASGSSQ